MDFEFSPQQSELVTEVLAAGGGGIATTLVYGLTVVFAILPIAREGTPEQRAPYLPWLLAGDIEACLAMTEPASGSDALKLQTRAERSGREWEITGQKTLISGADRARLMVVVARTGEFGSRRPDGITLVLVDPRSPERLLVTAGSLGTADLCLRLASDHARERIVFDRPVATYQGIAFPLAEAKARIDAAWLLNLRAASRFDRGLPEQLTMAQVAERVLGLPQSLSGQ